MSHCQSRWGGEIPSRARWIGTRPSPRVLVVTCRVLRSLGEVTESVGPRGQAGSAAGWYRDPWGVAAYRYFDGSDWTGWVAPGPSGGQPMAAHLSAPGRGIEILIVLSIFPLPYVASALAFLVGHSLGEHFDRVTLLFPGHPLASLPFALLQALFPLAAPLLVLYLLRRSGEGSRAIGLDRRGWRADLALLLPVFLLVVVGGLLVPETLLAGLGVRGLAPGNGHLPTYYAAVSVLSAVQAGVVEEIVVLGYLVHRLEQLGWQRWQVVGVAVLVRISYHVYYGWGVLAFVVWAAASVLVYQRYRRLAPFIAVHVLWDLGAGLVPFFHEVPLLVEAAILLPATLAFLVAWRRAIPRPGAPGATTAGPVR